MVTSFAALVMPQKLLQHSQSHTYKSMSVQVLLVTNGICNNFCMHWLCSHVRRSYFGPTYSINC